MSDDNDAEIARDTPNSPIENALEFRGGRSNALLLLWNLCGLALVCVVLGLQTKQRSLLTFVLIFAGLAVLLQVLGFIVSRRCRMLVTERELRMTSGPYSRIIAFDDVRSAEFIEDRKQLVLHLADGTAAPVVLGFYWKPAEARRAIESRLSQPITVRRSRVDLAAGPVAVLVLAIAAIVFPALFVYFMWLPKPLAFLAYGVAGGVALSFGLMALVPSSRAKRFGLSVACFVVFAVLVAFFTWLYLPAAPRAVELAIVRAALLVVGFGPGLAIPQAIARLREVNAERREALKPPQ